MAKIRCLWAKTPVSSAYLPQDRAFAHLDDAQMTQSSSLNGCQKSAQPCDIDFPCPRGDVVLNERSG